MNSGADADRDSGATLLVNARDPEELRVALIAGGYLRDLRWARAERESQVGHLYLGVVRQVEPGLDAAFVDYGAGRAGFLHLGNVHPGLAPAGRDAWEVAGATSEAAARLLDEGDAKSKGNGTDRASIQDYLRVDDRVVVQVLRDAVRGKGATLTTFVSLAGRLLVFMPTLGRLGISRRIREEKDRRKLRETLEAAGFGSEQGLIARTAAARATAEELQRDASHLRHRWEKAASAYADADQPGLLVAEETAAVRAVRDLYGPNVQRVIVDEPELSHELNAFFELYFPDQSPEIERYSKTRPLFEAFDVERDYQLLFRPRVPLANGASIVIHETEALTAIDVNSGRIDKGNLEDTAREANLLAAEEIARQIRLRDLGGIVVVDFIDMTRGTHRREVEAALRTALRADRARLKTGSLGVFGLMPLTRRRLGTGLPRATEWSCRHCSGFGATAAHRAGAMRVLRRLRAVDASETWRLRAHPVVLEWLEGEFEAGIASLEIDLEAIADGQVPPGEPVLERR